MFNLFCTWAICSRVQRKSTWLAGDNTDVITTQSHSHLASSREKHRGKPALIWRLTNQSLQTGLTNLTWESVLERLFQQTNCAQSHSLKHKNIIYIHKNENFLLTWISWNQFLPTSSVSSRRHSILRHCSFVMKSKKKDYFRLVRTTQTPNYLSLSNNVAKNKTLLLP